MNIEVVAKDLENTHLEKQNILDCISNLVKNISDPSLSIEEKQMSNILMPELTGFLKTLGEQSGVSKPKPETIIGDRNKKEPRRILSFNHAKTMINSVFCWMLLLC
ncbi:hypothetical protein RND59_00135 [Vibrio ruber]|uniref:hypothetical protein n=1 Tax=Vibrio ruber TaxID=184755 RepID=UPI002892D060|nr:hypothetical protein [Vibrio ruber]WNJ95567.1 hypothetical protein RND59_00135 [Vibrio ruber]